MSAAAIVLVEPDVLARYALAQYLRECGYVVLETAETQEAAILLDRFGDRVLAVLIDVQSSGAMDAFALTRWLRREHPSVQVLLAGNLAATAERAEGLCEHGPTLTKPYDHAQILARIRGLAARRDRT